MIGDEQSHGIVGGSLIFRRVVDSGRRADEPAPTLPDDAARLDDANVARAAERIARLREAR